MRTLKHLFENNTAWSERIRQQEPEFFLKLSQQHARRLGARSAARSARLDLRITGRIAARSWNDDNRPRRIACRLSDGDGVQIACGRRNGQCRPPLHQSW
jgi:hypothetical protein